MNTLERLFLVLISLNSIGELAGKPTTIRFKNGGSTGPRICYAEYWPGEGKGAHERIKIHLENGGLVIITRRHGEPFADVKYFPDKGLKNSFTVNMEICVTGRHISETKKNGRLYLDPATQPRF